MAFDRRTAIRLAGLGAGAALAGCLGSGGDGDETPTPTPDGAGIADLETVPLAVRNAAQWNEAEQVGNVVVADSRDRARNVLARYDPPEERREEIQAFLDDVEYDTDRVVLVESVGPNGCHDALEVDDVRLEGGKLRAAAAVQDATEERQGCTDAIVYPSTLLRVRFDGEQVDEVTVDVTDGWGETDAVNAGVDDPLPSPDPADLPGFVRPGDDPEPVAALKCDGDWWRHDQRFDKRDLQWGDFEVDGEPVLSLRVDDIDDDYGDTLFVTLTTVAGDGVSTGNRAKYNLQVYTEDGWQDVRVADGHFEYTDEAVEHGPGTGFQWSLELSEAGFVEEATRDDAAVCPDLQSARYRFAFFGVPGDGAVAVSFDLTV
jgi:hypothetical protein